MKRLGVLVVLIGVGLFFISILLSQGSSSQNRSMIDNIRSKEFVIYRGKPIYRKRIVLEGNPLKKVEEIDIFKGYRGKVAIPLDVMLPLAITAALAGAGMIIVNPQSKNRIKGYLTRMVQAALHGFKSK